MSFDVVIVGAGVAGLSAAIRLRQWSIEHEFDVSVVVLEKGAQVGAHILSGAIIDPVGLDQLLPQWRSMGAPLLTKVTNEQLSILSAHKNWVVPSFLLPRVMKQQNCYVGSLGALTSWLAKQAEVLGVEIYPGFAGAELLFDEQGGLKGVATPDQGLDEQGRPSDAFVPGMELHGRFTLVAEGARGFLAGQLIKHFHLHEGRVPAKYALGLKELWQVPGELHRAGEVRHMVGWPLPHRVGGGGFLYHYGDNLVSVGLVVHADYQDPALSPDDLFQSFKTHPSLRPLLAKGTRVGYGARVLSVGGEAAMPKAVFPGGMLIGCAAGLFDMARLKGVHNAMLSGMVAAECCFQQLGDGERPGDLALCYQTALAEKEIFAKLHAARNVKPLLSRFGLFVGGALSIMDLWIGSLFGKSIPVSLRHGSSDRGALKGRGRVRHQPIDPDGVVSFDRSTSLALSGVSHDEAQPPHLHFRDPKKQLENLHQFGLEPAQFYCPAKVYEIRQNTQGEAYLHISSSNCLHCKMCDLKDPADNIIWDIPPSGGPIYVDM